MITGKRLPNAQGELPDISNFRDQDWYTPEKGEYYREYPPRDLRSGFDINGNHYSHGSASYPRSSYDQFSSKQYGYNSEYGGGKFRDGTYGTQTAYGKSYGQNNMYGTDWQRDDYSTGRGKFDQYGTGSHKFTNDFRKAAEQSQQVQDQIRQLYGQGSGGQAPKGSEPGEQS